MLGDYNADYRFNNFLLDLIRCIGFSVILIPTMKQEAVTTPLPSLERARKVDESAKRDVDVEAVAVATPDARLADLHRLYRVRKRLVFQRFPIFKHIILTTRTDNMDKSHRPRRSLQLAYISQILDRHHLLLRPTHPYHVRKYDRTFACRHRARPSHQRRDCSDYAVELLPRHGICAAVDCEFERGVWEEESVDCV
jgi:hypothetical protein